MNDCLINSHVGLAKLPLLLSFHHVQHNLPVLHALLQLVTAPMLPLRPRLEETVLRGHALARVTVVTIVPMDGFVRLRKRRHNLHLVVLVGLALTAMEAGSVSLNRRQARISVRNLASQLPTTLALSHLRHPHPSPLLVRAQRGQRDQAQPSQILPIPSGLPAGASVVVGLTNQVNGRSTWNHLST